MKAKIVSKHSQVIDIINGLFILLFLYTALSKSFDISNTEYTIRATTVFDSQSLLLAWAVVIFEYVLVALLVIPKTKKIGLYLSVALMGLFTGFIAYMMAFVPKLPCSCGGVINKMNWTQHLFFNIFFILLGVAGLMLYRRQSKLVDNDENVQAVVFT